MTASLEFLLAQGWTRGLRFCFESSQDSQSLLNASSLKTLKQVHGTDLLNVSLATGVADGWVGTREEWAACTTRPAILTADCAPLVYVDRDRERLALVHAGWRGLRAGAHLKPFQEHGFDPSSTWIWCGPCLNGTSFEVEEDMWSTFGPSWISNSQVFVPTSVSKKKLFFAWRFLEQSFEQLGVEMFYNVEVDTFGALEFASHRRWKKQRENAGPSGLEPLSAGRNVTWLSMES